MLLFYFKDYFKLHYKAITNKKHTPKVTNQKAI